MAFFLCALWGGFGGVVVLLGGLYNLSFENYYHYKNNNVTPSAFLKNINRIAIIMSAFRALTACLVVLFRSIVIIFS